MSQLDIKKVHEFWNQFQDPMIYRVVTFMDGVEKWTHDLDEDFERVVEELSNELDNISKLDMAKLGKQDTFIRIANVLCSSRALRFLHVIDGVHPGWASRLLAHAEENTQSPDDEAGLFLRRNIVFERLRLLARVFDKEKLDLVIKALEGDDHG